MTDESAGISRRTTVKSGLGSLLLVGLAGCLGDDDDEPEQTDTTQDTGSGEQAQQQEDDTEEEQEEEGDETLFEEVEPDDVANEDGLIDTSYLRSEHLERIDRLDSYTVRIYNQTNVEERVIHVQGDVTIDGEEVYTEFGIFDDLTNNIEDRSNFEVHYDGSEEIYVRDETEGTTEYRNPSVNDDVLATELVQEETIQALLTPTSIHPYEDLETLISEGNVPYQETKAVETREMPERNTVHEFRHDSIDLLEEGGELEELVEEHGYLEEFYIRVVQENGLIGNTEFVYIDDRGDQGIYPQRYKAGLHSLNNDYEDLEPDWLNEAEVATR